MRDRVWTKSTRVLVVWIICAAAFALFNAVYWPIHHWQKWNAEPNYLARTEAALADDARDDAGRILHHGIKRFHPHSSDVWQLHAALSEAPEAAATARWYAALEQRQMPTVDLLYPDGLPARYATLNLAPHRESLQTLHDALLKGALVTPDGADTPVQQLAILEAAQGRLSVDGAIGRTGVTTPVSLLVQSGGGIGARRAAHIFVDGIDYASERRGFHATIVAPESGAVLQSGRFDLWEHPQEAHRMIRFLEDAPDGAIGLFAVFDDASVNLNPTLEEALLNYGLQREAWIDGRLRLLGIRYSFAAIGVKGSAPGTALQTWTSESHQGRAGHPIAVIILPNEGAQS